jgi:hypothetical protein
MANTYVAISNVTVGGSGTSSINFTSIPSTYTDLQILASIKSNRNDPNEIISVQFNTSGGTAYSLKYIIGNGGLVENATETGQSNFYFSGVASGGSSLVTSIFGNLSIYIPNYAGSTNKSISIQSVNERNASGNYTAYDWLTVGLWANTSAITSISLSSYASNTLVQYSTATLYGIKNS